MLELNGQDWKELSALREAFLKGSPSPYWTSERRLELYHHTFGQRIGWKWEAVIQDLKRLGWQPETDTVFDWGCGTGIATSTFVRLFPQIKNAEFYDRSKTAVDFARGHVELPTSGEAPYTLLISHVTTELDQKSFRQLDQKITTARAVIWVEPGTPEVSKRLVEIRERLKGSFAIVAPCPKLETCPLVTSSTKHWCHQYASVPNEVFQSSFWTKWGREMGIDLRSLPYSYLVLDKRHNFSSVPRRILGRPHKKKREEAWVECTPGGVITRREGTAYLPGAS